MGMNNIFEICQSPSSAYGQVLPSALPHCGAVRAAGGNTGGQGRAGVYDRTVGTGGGGRGGPVTEITTPETEMQGHGAKYTMAVTVLALKTSLYN